MASPMGNEWVVGGMTDEVVCAWLGHKVAASLQLCAAFTPLTPLFSCSSPPLAASQLKTDAAGLLPDGKVKVKLDYDGAVLEVDEDDVEKVGARSRSGPWQLDLLVLLTLMMLCSWCRPTLHHATGRRTWPALSISTSPASCTRCASAMVGTSFTPTPGPTWSSSTPSALLLCTPKRWV